MTKETAAKKSSRKKNVPMDKFIEAYQSDKFTKISEVASFLGVKPSAVSIRANKLKRGGVDLKSYPKGRTGSNIVEKAKKILESLKK